MTVQKVNQQKRLKRAGVYAAISLVMFGWALIPTSKMAENIFGRHLIDDSQALGLIVPFFLGVIFAFIAALKFLSAWYNSKPVPKKGNWTNTSKL